MSVTEYPYTTGTLENATKTVAYTYGKDGKSGWNNLLVGVDSDEERAMILETAKTHYAGTMVSTMLYCGLRLIEVRNLKLDDLDFTNDLLTVTKVKNCGRHG